MFVHNLDCRGIVNEALGEVAVCCLERVMVMFHDQLIEARSHQFNFLKDPGEQHFLWFTQIHLRLRYGMTSYKVQAQTIPWNVLVDCDKMDRDELYVYRAKYIAKL